MITYNKSGQKKVVPCQSFDEARRVAEIASFLLDIAIKGTLPKKEWTKWTNDTCFFDYRLESDRYKEILHPEVRIRSEYLPMRLYGKNLRQVEKEMEKEKNTP